MQHSWEAPAARVRVADSAVPNRPQPGGPTGAADADGTPGRASVPPPHSLADRTNHPRRGRLHPGPLADLGERPHQPARKFPHASATKTTITGKTPGHRVCARLLIARRHDPETVRKEQLPRHTRPRTVEPRATPPRHAGHSQARTQPPPVRKQPQRQNGIPNPIRPGTPQTPKVRGVGA